MAYKRKSFYWNSWIEYCKSGGKLKHSEWRENVLDKSGYVFSRKKYAREYYLRNKKKINAQISNSLKKRYNLDKIKVFDYYSGSKEWKCNCCGENEKDFLTIDHINNDGYLDRKGKEGLYARIIKNNFPNTFQVLCYNCNCSKGKKRNGGKCIHEIQEIV